jgi:hypothetical protein
LPGLEPAGGALCPLILGAYLADLSLVPDGPVGPVLEPVVLLPFLAGIEGDGAIEMRVGAATCRVMGGVLDGTAPAAGPATVHLSWTKAPLAAPKHLPDRATLAPDIAACLGAFAMRTYAPATEESRARGAGAGTSDND